MVFSSIPSYLDPSNWQQQPQNFEVGNTSTNPRLPPPPQPPPPPPQPHGGSIRPGSMAERARLANIPMPEGPLKCPRCDSINTKFCYFNNYSLSQPRHFCKTCRRYWTRGGALRNVPVGGGCRRNKRSKGGGGSTKTSVTGGSGGAACSGASSSTTAGTAAGSGASSNETLGLGATQLPPPLRFMAPLHYLNEFTNPGDIGSNFGGIMTASPLGDMSLHSSGGGYSSGGGSGMNVNYSLLERWRYEQAPHLTAMSGLDPQTGVYPFEGIVMGSSGLGPSGFSGGGSSSPANVTPPPPSSSSSTGGLIAQFSSVKMEDGNHHHDPELNLSSRMQLLGDDHHHHQLWNSSSNSNNPTGAWTDLSGFSSSTTTTTSSHL